ncbi:DUF1330 domain-containing protein [Antarcticirhabdus aurantiaca]|uniref:DUF1330 domain-containing protein n=1 Tax=Antarcticirhabdus aurantiaca TaxID=2606717 RepID=A0ACD4NP15_9HYPH|nr:DUF1330 domain-containing protein [Antarcticirhabdus aurantiaca]WAJ28528.1 DUF1330 domain-containing protein [Jeongeuplla avenae]
MPKAYWIARVDVHDPEGYKGYVETAAPAFREHGARFLARGGATHRLEGEMRARNVVIEFDSMEQARACYESEQYQKAKAIRERYATAEMMLVEGVE